MEQDRKNKLKSIEIIEVTGIIDYTKCNSSTIKPNNICFEVTGKIEYDEYVNNEKTAPNKPIIIKSAFNVDQEDFKKIKNEEIYDRSISSIYNQLYSQNTNLYFSGVQENVIKEVILYISKIEVLSYEIIKDIEDSLVTVNVSGSISILKGMTAFTNGTVTVKTSFLMNKSDLPTIEKRTQEELEAYVKRASPIIYERSLEKGMLKH